MGGTSLAKSQYLMAEARRGVRLILGNENTNKTRGFERVMSVAIVARVFPILGIDVPNPEEKF